MLEIPGIGDLVDSLTRLHISQNNDEGFAFGINRRQVKTDIPYGVIPEPVKIKQMTTTEKFDNTNKLRP